MSTYAEFLKSQGATDEDIKLLDTPVAQKAYKAAQDRITAAERAAQEATTKVQNYDKWFQDEMTPAAAKLQAERDAALADAAAERARVKALQEAGLIAAAEQDKPGSTVAKPNETPAFDPQKHNLVTRDILASVADAEGDAIAAMQDIADEHRELFGTRINAKELRAEAKAQKKTLEQVWTEKYNVPAKRAEKAAADKAAYEKKIADEAVAKYRSENLNPATGAPMPSRTPFTGKPAATGTSSMPWQNENERANARVNKALESLNKTAPFSGPVN